MAVVEPQWFWINRARFAAVSMEMLIRDHGE